VKIGENMSKFNINPLMLPDKDMGAIFIDCEATGLSEPTYPISIGISCENGFESQCLIKPDIRWPNFQITEGAYQIHKIDNNELMQYGYSINDVALWLSDIAKMNPVFFSDNPAYEHMWLKKLYLNTHFPIQVGAVQNHIMNIAQHIPDITQKTFEKYMDQIRLENPHTHNAVEDARFWAKFSNFLRSKI